MSGDDPLKGAPGYWMYETSGVLRPAVEAYLEPRAMTEDQIAALRSYFRQWICAPVWGSGADIVNLRERVETLTTRRAITVWLDDAEAIGINPL